MSESVPTRGEESAFEPSAIEPPPAAELQARRWMGWRRRALVAAALLGGLAVFAFVRWLAAGPYLDVQATAQGGAGLVLQGSALPQLQAQQGRAWVTLADANGRPQPVDALLLHRSPRWQLDDAHRARQIAQHEALARQLAAGRLQLGFDDGVQVTLAARPRGYAGLGLLVWPLLALAFVLYLFAVTAVLARTHPRNLLFGLLALCQGAQLLLSAIATTRGLGLPPGLATLELELRLALDACSGAALVHAFLLHPYRLPRSGHWALLSWTGAAALWVLVRAGLLVPAWWWAQALCLGLGLLALAVMHRSYRTEPNPLAIVLQRFALVALATLALVTAAVAAAAGTPALAHGVAVGAPVVWYLLQASLVLLTPFLARSRQVLRELALLAGISAVAGLVDLLFVSVFSLGAFTSLAVAVFAALAVYAGARQFILNHVLGGSLLTTERIFEQMYRAAREVQARPRRYPQALGQLLRELFEPLEMVRIERVPVRARVLGGGSALVVPLRGADPEQPASAALQMRFAQRGQRLFTLDDARLADRLVELLRRAVAYDQAVERGRHEERQRLAQDLHDDIGARLLTLMYQAPTPDMEDYIRHTLQDLKTLTRGLAASEHRLSHAAAEWKADLSQRLAAAQAQLGWSCSYEEDLRLSVVQWSALTRVLRELVSNALFHGHATRVDVALVLEGARLSLAVADDGGGRDPQAWSHGLGMGGVRKRVKLLGGSVAWRENASRGIVCEVLVDDFTRQA